MTTGLGPARGATGEAGPFLPLRELPPLPVQWQSLPRAFIRQARALGPRTAMVDSTGTSLTYGQTLLAHSCSAVSSSESGARRIISG